MQGRQNLSSFDNLLFKIAFVLAHVTFLNNIIKFLSTKFKYYIYFVDKNFKEYLPILQNVSILFINFSTFPLSCYSFVIKTSNHDPILPNNKDTFCHSKTFLKFLSFPYIGQYEYYRKYIINDIFCLYCT